MDEEFEDGYVWGEIYVSSETAVSESKKRGTREEDEMLLYINEGQFSKSGHIIQTIEEFRDKIDELVELADKLEDVFHAIEWRCSCDWGDDTINEVFNKYVEENM